MFEGYELAIYSLVALAFTLAAVGIRMHIDKTEGRDKPA